MKITKEQIIDYLNAGYKIRLTDVEGVFYLLGFNNATEQLYGRDTRGGYADFDWSFIEDDNTKFEIKPRYFKPLPVGTKVYASFDAKKERRYIKKYETGKYFFNGSYVPLAFNDVIPVIEEQKEEWEDEFDQFFEDVSYMDAPEFCIKYAKTKIKDFIKKLLSDNK